MEFFIYHIYSELSYLTILHTPALPLTADARIKNLVKRIVPVEIETSTLRKGNTPMATQNVAFITHAALLTETMTAGWRGQIKAGNFTSRTTKFIVAVDRTLNT